MLEDGAASQRPSAPPSRPKIYFDREGPWGAGQLPAGAGGAGGEQGGGAFSTHPTLSPYPNFSTYPNRADQLAVLPGAAHPRILAARRPLRTPTPFDAGRPPGGTPWAQGRRRRGRTGRAWRGAGRQVTWNRANFDKSLKLRSGTNRVAHFVWEKNRARTTYIVKGRPRKIFWTL
jgi:hypothetical protein